MNVSQKAMLSVSFDDFEGKSNCGYSSSYHNSRLIRQVAQKAIYKKNAALAILEPDHLRSSQPL